MAIEERRFEAFDKEFNLATVDLTVIKDHEIINTASNSVKQISSAVSGALGSLKSALNIDGIKASIKQGMAAVTSIQKTIQSNIDAAKGLYNDVLNSELVREVQGLYDSIMDLSKLDIGDIENALFDLFPDNHELRSLFNSIADNCKSKSFAGGGLGKPFDIDIGCGTKDGKDGCTTANMANFLNSASGGAYASAYEDKNKLLEGLTKLSNIGYDVNLCGIFGGMIADAKYDGKNDVLMRGASLILAQQAPKGNATAILDMSKSASTTKPHIQLPNVVELAATGFKADKTVSEKEYVNFSDRYVAALEALDPNWVKDDGKVTSSKFGKVNNEFNEMLSVRARSRNVPVDLDEVTDIGDEVALFAYMAGNNVSQTWA